MLVKKTICKQYKKGFLDIHKKPKRFDATKVELKLLSFSD